MNKAALRGMGVTKTAIVIRAWCVIRRNASQYIVPTSYKTRQKPIKTAVVQIALDAVTDVCVTQTVTEEMNSFVRR